jgi:hypothetical protein
MLEFVPVAVHVGFMVDKVAMGQVFLQVMLNVFAKIMQKQDIYIYIYIYKHTHTHTHTHADSKNNMFLLVILF